MEKMLPRPPWWKRALFAYRRFVTRDQVAKLQAEIALMQFQLDMERQAKCNWQSAYETTHKALHELKKYLA